MGVRNFYMVSTATSLVFIFRYLFCWLTLNGHEYSMRNHCIKFAYHMITFFLLVFTWVCNLHRIGTLVLGLHICGEILDTWLRERDLMCFGMKIFDSANLLFLVFSVITRLIIFPFIIYNTLVDMPSIPMFPATGYYVFNSLLIMLLCLHMSYILKCKTYWIEDRYVFYVIKEYVFNAL